MVLEACSWIWVPCVLSRSAVPAIIADVVVLIASILSSTIFWCAERERHGHRDLQRADGDVDGPIDTADQFAVVANDDLDRQDALLIDRELLLEIERALTK